MLHSLRSQTGIRYLQSGSTTLQVVLHGEVPGVPPPLAVERLPGECAPPGDSGARGESQEAGLEPVTQLFCPNPPEEVRNPALLECDVAPPALAEAELCAQRLTGRPSQTREAGLGAGRPGKRSPGVPKRPQEWREGEFFEITHLTEKYMSQ